MIHSCLSNQLLMMFLWTTITNSVNWNKALCTKIVQNRLKVTCPKSKFCCKAKLIKAHRKSFFALFCHLLENYVSQSIFFLLLHSTENLRNCDEKYNLKIKKFVSLSALTCLNVSIVLQTQCHYPKCHRNPHFLHHNFPLLLSKE